MKEDPHTPAERDAANARFKQELPASRDREAQRDGGYKKKNDAPESTPKDSGK